jgi:hypothetical protein
MRVAVLALLLGAAASAEVRAHGCACVGSGPRRAAAKPPPWRPAGWAAAAQALPQVADAHNTRTVRRAHLSHLRCVGHQLGAMS